VAFLDEKAAGEFAARQWRTRSCARMAPCTFKDDERADG
jgi:hypothetical protein